MIAYGSWNFLDESLGLSFCIPKRIDGRPFCVEFEKETKVVGSCSFVPPLEEQES